MSFRDGIRRDIHAKRQHDRAADEQHRFQRIADLVPLTRTGQMSHRSFLEITRQILDGDAARVVRVGEELRPDMNTGEER